MVIHAGGEHRAAGSHTGNTHSVMLELRAWDIVPQSGWLAWWLKAKRKKKKTLQAIASHSNLNNLLRAAVIFPHMHNADAKFNNKGEKMTSKGLV